VSRRPYVRTARRSWWLSQPRYFRYMMRELTSLFIGIYCALLGVGVYRLSQGKAAWDAFVAAVSSPPGILLQLLCLAFAIYHSTTWFAVTPKAMPLIVKGKAVRGPTIVAFHYGAWALLSLVVLIAAGI
jgi:succinate dehydrogenase subunit C